MAHPLENLVIEGSSRQILAAVRSNLINLADYRQVGSPRQMRVQHSLKREAMQSDKLIETIVEAKPTQQSQRFIRLASYHAETPVRALRVAPEDVAPSYSLRAVVGRVHSVIKKYAPKHKSAGSLAHSIVQESARQGVDPLFVAAVIKSESTFNSAAHSRRGAQGLMQIMPATGAWLTERNDLPRGRLTDPGHNLRLGISYLKHLEQSYNGNRVFALVAYNWGPGHVDSAAGGKRKIPKECMQYALKIIQDYKRWSAGVI
jgi:soluble lytic murein transglycosylase